MKIRWQATMGDEPLWPSSDPVVMIMRGWEPGGVVLRGWHLSSPVVARGVDSELLDPGSHDVLTAGGRASIYNRIVQLPADEAHPQPFWDSVGIYRVDIPTGTHERAGFDPRPARLSHLNPVCGGSPGADSALIAQNWSLPTAPAPDISGLSQQEAATASAEWRRRTVTSFRVTISLATFDGAPARDIVTLNAQVHSSSPDGTAIQWSPDGRLAAIELKVPETRTRSESEVHVFDTSTWDVVARYKNASLAGSACRGPDSDRLLLEHHVDTNWVQHLDGTRQPITVLPASGGKMMRPTRPLGMADNDHLLTLGLRKDRATVMRTSIADGTHEGLFAWTGTVDMYPKIAQMPPETWI